MIDCLGARRVYRIFLRSSYVLPEVAACFVNILLILQLGFLFIHLI